MRGIVIPSKSAAHKLACLALYRSLLEQASRFDGPVSTTLRLLITRRFKFDRRIQSPTVICNCLQQGRKARDLIRDAANGSAACQSQLLAAVEEAAQYARDEGALRTHQLNLRRPTSPGKLLKIAHLERHKDREWAKKIPSPIPLFERPVPKERLPNPDKPRHVPILASFQGIPFLRYKSGAQSRKLTATLSGLDRQSVKRWDALGDLEHVLEFAKLEDQWDKLLEHMEPDLREMNIFTDQRGRARVHGWTDDLVPVVNGIYDVLGRATRKREQTAQKMMGIVHAEKQLAETEKAERKAEARAKVHASQSIAAGTLTGNEVES